MIEKEFEGLQWLEFELLADCPIIHACFKRYGGYSNDHLASLNLSKNVGDAEDNVQKNLVKVARALEIEVLVAARLCHGADIIQMTNHNFPQPISDGLSTKALLLGLSVTQADCQAAIFYDPLNHAIANIHCGWKGSVQNIYLRAIRHMRFTYGSLPQNLLVAISPSLGPQSSQFINFKAELPSSFWDFQVKQEYFNFWEISRWQLQEAGILPHHIQIASIDTFANANDYFSHRRSHLDGRQATLCALKPKNSL